MSGRRGGGRVETRVSGRQVIVEQDTFRNGTGPQSEPRLVLSPLVGQLALRLYRDFVAAVMTIFGAAMLLGLVMMLSALQGQGLNVGADKLGRWLANALPLSALLVFFFSHKRDTPWFAGILAALVAFLLPGMAAWVRLVLLVVLSLVFGAADMLMRRQVMRRGRA